MKRFPLPSLALAVIAAALLSACRGGPAGLPAGPSALMQSPPTAGENLAKLSERTMHSPRVGTSNTITADMPVPRPDTTPCVVTLFNNFNFKNFSDKSFNYAPPAACPKPWSKVVFNFDLRVTKGVQYDRTGTIWVDGAVIYFGSTAEPSPQLSPHWHVERDVTDLSALFAKSSTGQIDLWNCYCPPTYNGFQHGTAYLQFYPADKKYPAPRVADDVIGIPYAPPLGGLATLPKSPMALSKALPKNIERAYLDVYLQSQSKEEQWFMCVPDKVWAASAHALGFCRGTSFREGVVSVDGQSAGLAPIYPWIFTGGMDPNLWFPIPGVQTLEFVPYRVDLTPFAAMLSSGGTQTIDVSVFRAYDYFSGAGDLLLFRDHSKTQVTGGLTQDTLTVPPDLVVEDGISYGTGAGMFGGPTATGSVVTRSRANYSISGYLNGAAGKITTTVVASGLYTNRQDYDYGAHHYIQLMKQSTHFATTSTTSGASGTQRTEATYDYPLTISYPILPTSTGYRLPIKVYQAYRVQTADGADGRFKTALDDTVKSDDTMIFNSAFSWIGVRNGYAQQLYTYSSNRPQICYGKQIKAKNNVVTLISEPGCTALPPPRPQPRR